MKIDNIDIDATLSEVELLLEEDKNISPALISIITVLLLLTNRAGLNSSNSSSHRRIIKN